MAYEHEYHEPVLEVKNVNISYDRPILRDLSFEVLNITRPGMTQGQVVAILAPSGMGKSQAFRCISGLNKPNSGAILLHGGAQVEVGKVGVVAQNYPLFEHMTVLENVLTAAKIKTKDAKTAHDVAMKILERFGLADQRNLYPRNISGGQQQRTAIAQQMVCSGHLLLMDEPFSGLDVLVQQEVQAMISELATADELNTIVITTHSIGSALAIADDVILLGRERDAKGAAIPGANVRFRYNLIEEGLAWHPEITQMPRFAEIEREIRARFREL